MSLAFEGLDHAGIAEFLKSDELGVAVAQLAQEIADNVDAQGAPVVVDTYVTDRQAASVTIADASGALLQAQDGVLTRAAAAAGLEVRAR